MIASRDGREIAPVLLKELSEHRSRALNETLVFPSYDRDGRVVPLADVKGAFGWVPGDAGIGNFRFHDLRHTFASHYMMSGGNLIHPGEDTRSQGLQNDPAVRAPLSRLHR
jgi:integrase